MPDDSDDASTPPALTPPALRAQLLATEHWSLLASRSTTQSEVLTRIAMFLTLTSAGLLSLALMGQATKFTGVFPGFAIAVLAIVLLVGILTQLRVANTNMEDLAYVLAMNRLRGAYLELDPGLAPYLLTSRFDDRAGAGQTYYFHGRPAMSQLAASSLVFIVAVNSTLLGLLVSAVAGILGAGIGVMSVTGAAFGLAYFVLCRRPKRSHLQLVLDDLVAVVSQSGTGCDR